MASIWFRPQCDCDSENIVLTHKQLEMYGCIFSPVATDALVLKHQAISIHSADWIFIVLNWPTCIQKYYSYGEQYKKIRWYIVQNNSQLFKG